MNRESILDQIWIFVLLVVAGATGIALAQPAPAPDPQQLQRALGVVQQQRNSVMDSLASSEIRLSACTDDLAKAQARIKELEPKQPDQK